MHPPRAEASVAALRLYPPVANGEFYYGRNALHKIEAILATAAKKNKKGKNVPGGAEEKAFGLQELADFLKDGKYKLESEEVI